MSKQQVFNTFSNQVDGLVVCHGRQKVNSRIVGLKTDSYLQSNLLVLAVWFTRRSSTGSRSPNRLWQRLPSVRPRSACAAPATVKRTNCSRGFALSHIATGCLEQATGKADRVVFASPDTGQQGEAAFIRGFVTSMHCRGRR